MKKLKVSIVKKSVVSFSLNFFGAKCQATFVGVFFILTNYRLERRLYVKLKD